MNLDEEYKTIRHDSYISLHFQNPWGITLLDRVLIPLCLDISHYRKRAQTIYEQLGGKKLLISSQIPRWNDKTFACLIYNQQRALREI